MVVFAGALRFLLCRLGGARGAGGQGGGGARALRVAGGIISSSSVSTTMVTPPYLSWSSSAVMKVPQ